MSKEKNVIVTSAESIPEKIVHAGNRTSMQVLIGPGDAPNFAMRRFLMEPGGGMPNHTNTVEHEQFILSGRAQVGIGEAVYEVKKGDVVFIPGGVPHWYKAAVDEPFEFLCVVPNSQDEIRIVQENDS